MPIRQITTHVGKARGPGKPVPATIARLRDAMQRVVVADLNKGFSLLPSRANLGPDELFDAARTGRFAAITKKVDWAAFKKDMQPLKSTLLKGAANSSEKAAAQLPKHMAEQLRYDTTNQRITTYIDNRVGAMVQNVTDSLQVKIIRAVKDSFVSGKTPAQVARDIRHGLPLNERQQIALNNFRGTDRQAEAYAKRLQRHRSMMIARTEIAATMNQGQIEVWRTARDQDLLPQGSKKVWVTAGDPCPYICEPMEGVAVDLDEDFELPTGESVEGPVAHPCCACLLSIEIGL